MTDSTFGKTMIRSTFWEIKHYWQQHILEKKTYLTANYEGKT
jgi:uncharacterized protein YqgQ